MADYQSTDLDVSPARPVRVLAAGVVLPRAVTPHLRLIEAGPDLAAALAAERPDLLLVHAARIDPALAALLTGAEADLPLAVVAGGADAEAVGLLLERDHLLLDDDASEQAMGAALLALAAASGSGVADASKRYETDARLAALKRDAERVAAALAELAGTRTGSGEPVTAARIRNHIKARRQRDRFFPAELFADPAWDILLDLAAARLEERPVSVSSLCIAAHVPTTTALRTIKQLVDRGLLTRRSDPADARRSFVALSITAAAAMELCLDAVLNHPGQ